MRFLALLTLAMLSGCTTNNYHTYSPQPVPQAQTQDTKEQIDPEYQDVVLPVVQHQGESLEDYAVRIILALSEDCNKRTESLASFQCKVDYSEKEDMFFLYTSYINDAHLENVNKQISNHIIIPLCSSSNTLRAEGYVFYMIEDANRFFIYDCNTGENSDWIPTQDLRNTVNGSQTNKLGV